MALLVTSGLTVAWAAQCGRLRRYRIAQVLLVATLVLTVAFLGALFFQTRGLLERGLGWGTAFVPVTAVEATVEAPAGNVPPGNAASVEAPAGDATTTPRAPYGPAGLRSVDGESASGPPAPVPRYGGLFFGVIHLGSLVQATWALLGVVAVLWNLARIRVTGLDLRRMMAMEALARLWQPAVAYGILAYVVAHLVA